MTLRRSPVGVAGEAGLFFPKKVYQEMALRTLISTHGNRDGATVQRAKKRPVSCSCSRAVLFFILGGHYVYHRCKTAA